MNISMRMNAQRKYSIFECYVRRFFSLFLDLLDTGGCSRSISASLLAVAARVRPLWSEWRIVVHFFMVPVLIVVGKNIKWRMDDDGTCMHRM